MSASRIALIAATAVVATGCGGGGGSGGGSSIPATPAASVQQDVDAQIAFSNGALACSAYNIKDLAGFYGTSTKPDAIAKAVAAANGTTPATRDAARRGCLSVFKKKPRK